MKLKDSLCFHFEKEEGREKRNEEAEGYVLLFSSFCSLKKGLPLHYDKLALLSTSIFKLSHWRNDVTIASYMLA